MGSSYWASFSPGNNYFQTTDCRLFTGLVPTCPHSAQPAHYTFTCLSPVIVYVCNPYFRRGLCWKRSQLNISYMGQNKILSECFQIRLTKIFSSKIPKDRRGSCRSWTRRELTFVACLSAKLSTPFLCALSSFHQKGN